LVHLRILRRSQALNELLHSINHYILLSIINPTSPWHMHNRGLIMLDHVHKVLILEEMISRVNLLLVTSVLRNNILKELLLHL
jgi:hypothetical protein